MGKDWKTNDKPSGSYGKIRKLMANIQGYEGCRLPTYKAMRAVGCQHTGL